MVFALALVFVVILTLEVPSLVRQKMWKELAVFLGLLAVGAVYSFGQVFDWPLPNPTKAVEAIFKPVAEVVEKVLG